MGLPEFVKVGKVFQAMSSNLKSMLELSKNLHGLLYSKPSEDAKLEVAAEEEEMETEQVEPDSSQSADICTPKKTPKKSRKSEKHRRSLESPTTASKKRRRS
ncbi:unnamed protein product [Dibothriocephalus latus]|uniref:Uncharacterized protein n=1 Tax=Dibothriocephalus latus TaxID=60516 RepID=A0A3P7NKM7_DIBLA|nr:unnamed protein product [Dibothriocephalus latus]